VMFNYMYGLNFELKSFCVGRENEVQ